MIKAIFPGTFDPITNGHIDIIERTSKFVHSLTVLVAVNSAKNTYFTEAERVEHVEFLTRHLENVRVVSAGCLIADFARKIGANIIIRGLRNGTDFDYEQSIAEVQKKIEPSIETLFIAAKPEFSYLSSTVVKEVFSYGGDISGMVSKYIIDRLIETRQPLKR